MRCKKPHSPVGENIKFRYFFYSGTVVKKKIKNLKDHYRKEKSKICTSRSGAGGSNIYTELKWQYFKMLGFLDDSITCEPTDDNLLNTNNVDANIQSFDQYMVPISDNASALVEDTDKESTTSTSIRSIQQTIQLCVEGNQIK